MQSLTHHRRFKTPTPWGEADHSEEEIPGITRHHTPSHGGLHCDTDRQKAIASLFPAFRPWAKGPWYEEDCDWSLPVAVFWREYLHIKGGRNVMYAVRTLQGSAEYFGSTVATWLEGNRELLEAASKIAEQYPDA